MGKVWERNNANAPYANRLAQHDLGIAQMLQGVDLQNHIKALVAKQSQALVEIELDHIHATLHTGQQVGAINFDAVAAAATGALQMCQHGTIAAA